MLLGVLHGGRGRGTRASVRSKQLSTTYPSTVQPYSTVDQSHETPLPAYVSPVANIIDAINTVPTDPNVGPELDRMSRYSLGSSPLGLVFPDLSRREIQFPQLLQHRVLHKSQLRKISHLVHNLYQCTCTSSSYYPHTTLGKNIVSQHTYLPGNLPHSVSEVTYPPYDSYDRNQFTLC